MTARLGVITGLKREARCLTPVTEGGPLVGISGANSERAGRLARDLVERGCTGLLSFGLAGGLEPSLEPGTVVLADAVVTTSGGQFGCDEQWLGRVQSVCEGLVGEGLSPPNIGAIVGSNVGLATVDAKVAARAATGALAVDMESHAAGAVAKHASIPFLAVRVIADTRGMVIPDAAMGAFTPDGGLRPLSVLVGLLTRPRDLPAMMELIRSSEKAFRILRRVALRLGPGFLLG